MVKSKKAAKTGGKWRGKPSYGLLDNSPKVFARSSSSGLPSQDIATKFSLRDAARNTDRYRTKWADPDQNLRSQAIGFVRGSDALKGSSLEDVRSSFLPLQPQHESLGLLQRPSPISPSTSIRPPQLLARTQSPTVSDSSEEIIIFTGRQRSPQLTPYSPQALACEQFDRSISKECVEDSISISEAIGRHSELSLGTVSPQPAQPHREPGDLDYTEPQGSFQVQSGSTKRKDEEKRYARHSIISRSDNDDSDAYLADYMHNMQAYGELDDDFVFQAQALDADVDGWSPSDLVDFNDLSTSTEVAGALDSVLAKRSRASGLQYLVVWQGQTADEARWIHHESLSMDGANELIKAFEKQEMLGENSTDTSRDNELDEADIEGHEHNGEESPSETDEYLGYECDLIERRTAKMTDEQIARLLTKQEEVGMGSDELMLFDDLGDTLTNEDDTDEDGYLAFDSQRHRGKTKAPRKKSFRSPFEPFLGSAHELLGDDYGDYDVMNFDRPSLGKRNKSQGLEVALGFSGSDLEAELREQFAMDRRKKKAKKQEREELRAQGLLGKKNKFKPDLAARYSDGLSISQFEIELEEFLMSRHQTLALPAMAKRERKIIHEVASQFFLKSKSVGSGKSRFPTLYKTSRTTGFDAAVFKRVERRLQRSFLPRMGGAGRGKAGLPARRSGGGGIVSGTGYAEGETVGASAPELGSENRGRAMLEKMGWSTGMGLGALDNKGILQPISHVVKRTRAGLG